MKDLVNLYLEFDSGFFRDNMDEEKPAERYRAFLKHNKQELNSFLLNETNRLDNNIYEKLLKLIDFEYKHTTLIRKHTDFNPLTITIDDLCKEAGVKLTEHQKNYLVGRVELHLARLMFPETYSDRLFDFFGINQKLRNCFCPNFGKEFIRYVASTPKEVKRTFLDYTNADKFRGVVGTESHDVFLFWTLAPYIHQDLKQRGILPSRSAERIVKWAIESYSNYPTLAERDYMLKHCRSIGHMINFPLGLDERMPSHLLARLYAKEVSKELAK